MIKRFKSIHILNYLFLLSSLFLKAQEITLQEYERAVAFMNYGDMVHNLYTNVNWYQDGTGFWFVDKSEEGNLYKTVYFKGLEVKPLFNQEKLALALNGVLGKNTTAKSISITKVENINKDKVELVAYGKTLLLDLNTYQLEFKEGEKDEKTKAFESLSPNGKWLAYTKEYNLFIKSVETDQEFQLSFNGKKGYEYATYYGWFDLMEGENGERPKQFNVSWSNDSKWLKTNVVDFRNAEKMYLLDYSVDSLYKPKLLSYYRGSPGDTTLVKVKPVFFNVATKKEVKTNLPTQTHINPVSIEWMKASGKLIANWKERGFQKEYVKEVDLKTNTEKDLIVEVSQTNIDNFKYTWVKGWDKLLFLSERSGWRQLYVLDLKTGIERPLTQGNFFINSIEYIDEGKGDVYLLASGKEEGNNPYHQQLYKVDLKGNMVNLTSEKGHHRIVFSKDGKFVVDNYSTVTMPTKTWLREAVTGKILALLSEANVDQAVARGWEPPQEFQLTAKDGKTTIYGAIWKPSNFDASKTYPIIDATYTGPHTQLFPKSFDVAFANQALAELGFVVMQVDGLGTYGRSKAFHDQSYKDMGNNLVDHVKAIQYLGEKYSWIDAERAGIFGHSAGGYDTGRAMLAFPEVYKVGVASSADHDFRMEKAWWPEMYQGWPVDKTYHEVSNITNAKNLQGKLLLVHGGLDDNVNPSATFKLAEALVKANKEFDLLILPSQRHGYSGVYRDYFIKKRWNYFVEHLRGVKPIWNFKFD
ncbi:S9 family peptidase [Aestuariivivens insulae]|uniref:S9 family peptidase n=1 Tax=Aestuariivivens insulae TaxID=1621988 RepID=UPI001F58FD6F|nr:prolyl oligopeptidase family serine peptidase [Aestuariivivens insulae]